MRSTWRTWTAPLAASLILLATVGANAAPTGGEACFEQAFQKSTAKGSWLVRECADEAGLRYRITFGSPPAQARVHLPQADGIVDVDYKLLGPETLLIDAYAERGGHAWLVRPVGGSTTLSVAEFDYMSDDEEGLEVRQDGKRIVARTRHGTHVFTVDARGALRRAPAASPKPKKGGQGS